MSEATRRRTWRDGVWLCAIGTSLLLGLLPFASYIVCIPFARDEWGMSNAAAGWVFSAYLIGSALSAALLLPLTDRVPAGRVVFGGVAAMALANLLFPLLADGVWSAAALRCAAGAGHIGAYIPGVRIVSARFAGRGRGGAVGLFVALGFAGTTGSYALTGALLEATGSWREAMVALAGALLDAAGSWREAHHPVETNSWREAYLLVSLIGLGGVALALPFAREGGGGESRGGRGTAWLNPKIFGDRRMLMVNVAYALHTAEMYLARVWLPLLLAAALARDGADESAAAARAAQWAGLMFMTGIAGVFAGGVLSDRVGRANGAALIFAVSGAASFVIGWLVGAPTGFAIALGFLYGFATAADSAIYTTAATEFAPPRLIGSTQAAQNLIGFSVGAVAPVAAGGILDAFAGANGWGIVFAFNGLLAVGGVSALLALRRMGG